MTLKKATGAACVFALPQRVECFTVLTYPRVTLPEQTRENVMSVSLVWILIGLLLIVSELMATSVIAVFFGIAAIVVGLLLQLGLIESMAAQFTVFAVISLLTLLLARGKFQRWFKGHTADASEGKPDFQHDIGARGIVVDDFVHGSGRITINGVRWKAFCDEDLKSGDAVWVASNNGIELTVTRNKPGNV